MFKQVLIRLLPFALAVGFVVYKMLQKLNEIEVYG